MFPARIELATFRVLGGRDNHYTTETATKTYEKLEMSYRGARNFCGFSNDPQK